ncbi:putative branched-subunit amino acid permease [Spinactinospora alkalitolerans]|uniref:Putative branched-subunit amino acid permease n=1 Tax=Spinactinospora alkalitolerans TaxID=687207 RepID=A0A852U3R8_9ACTN|nr:AzlC family ABC transporter permease [Spinactinospora alkalitolerans]NYE48600.1 putative branched-subunit amino acid permease [Spinactinospora alkalitolerans]
MNRSALSLSTLAAPSPPVRDALGVGFAVGVSGLAFGTSAVTAGLSVAQACALSLLCFTGASQFALVGVVAGGGNLAAGALGALMLGGRNTLYGLRLADLLGWRGARRAVAAHGVIDETTAVALAQTGRADARTGFSVTFATLFVMWNTTTLVGAVATESIGDPDVFGLDAVGPAIFLALLWPRLTEGGRAVPVALLGAAIALGTTPLLPSGVPVLLAAAAALVGMGPAAKGPATDGRVRS